jgi:trehalose 6-phosphate phosphatase
MIELPPFNRAALLLDLDGTLLDIAPTPDSVVVEPGLVESLRAVRGYLDNALAVVTGRPIETIDRLLDDAPYAVAGEHGGVVRHAPGGEAERPDLPAPPEIWLQNAEWLAVAYPGALLERKARGFSLHYRAVPDAGPVFRDALTRMVGESGPFDLLAGHMLWEVRPRGADKGRAVTVLMQRAPFAGRLPLFIGDDVTDEDGMRVAVSLGGGGLRVDAAFGSPAGVRAWLRAAAAQGGWPPLPGGKSCG